MCKPGGLTGKSVGGGESRGGSGIGSRNNSEGGRDARVPSGSGRMGDDGSGGTSGSGGAGGNSAGNVEHYFSNAPLAASARATVSYELPTGHLPGQSQLKLKFITDSGVFSKRRVDFGTDLLIRSMPPLLGKVLDLGCGYGAAGIALALLNPGVEMWFSDINERAVELCRENCSRLLAGTYYSAHDINGVELLQARVVQADGLEWLRGTDALFDAIVANPPVRAGKEHIYKLFEGAHNALNEGGAYYIVIQKKQGMASAANKLSELFGNCMDIARKAGYHVLKSVKLQTGQ
ncbi:MAG: methyltransferase [Oscillospiraceae bacterium]|nr:methyltransferase [Oscillospiraceae bacterium]